MTETNTTFDLAKHEARLAETGVRKLSNYDLDTHQQTIDKIGGVFDLGNVPPERQDYVAGDLLDCMRRRDELLDLRTTFCDDIREVLGRPDMILALSDDFREAVGYGYIKLPKNQRDPSSYPCEKTPGQVFDEKLEDALSNLEHQAAYLDWESLGFESQEQAARLTPKQAKAIQSIVEIIEVIEPRLSTKDYPATKYRWTNVKGYRRDRAQVKESPHSDDRTLGEILGNIGDVAKLAFAVLTKNEIETNKRFIARHFSLEKFLQYDDEQLDRFQEICDMTRMISAKYTYLISEYGIDFLVGLSSEQFEVIAESVTAYNLGVDHSKKPRIAGGILPEATRATVNMMSPGQLKMALHMNPANFPAGDDLERFLVLPTNVLKGLINALNVQIFKLNEAQIAAIATNKYKQNRYMSNSVSDNGPSSHIDEEDFVTFSPEKIARLLGLEEELYDVINVEIIGVEYMNEKEYRHWQSLAYNLERSESESHGNIPLEEAKAVIDKYGWYAITTLSSSYHIDTLFTRPDIAAKVGLEEFSRIPKVALEIAHRDFKAPAYPKDFEPEQQSSDLLLAVETYTYFGDRGDACIYNDASMGDVFDCNDWWTFLDTLYCFLEEGNDIDAFLAEINNDSAPEDFIAYIQRRAEAHPEQGDLQEKFAQYLDALPEEKRTEVLTALNFSKFTRSSNTRREREEILSAITTYAKEKIGDEILARLSIEQLEAVRDLDIRIIDEFRDELPDLSPEDMGNLEIEAGLVQL